VDIELDEHLPRYEVIYQVLREHLIGGRLPSNLIISESGVARVFKTSRIPARSALRRLHDEGLLHDFGGRGYSIDPSLPETGRIRLDVDQAGLVLPSAVSEGAVGRTRGERIYPEVEQVIAARLAFGRSLVNESALAEQYGVSRAITHEVLTKLGRVGLINRDSNQRWYAGPLTADLVRSHFEMRWLLEPAALIQAAPKLSTRDLQKRRDHVERIRTGHPTPANLERVEYELHVETVGLADNPVMREAIRKSQLPLIALHSTFRRHKHADEIETMTAEHVEIFDYLVKGRADKAAASLRAHLERSLDVNLTLLANLKPLAPKQYPDYLVPEQE
jgi:DNA-binding GntR family transcriptional regulator